ncbi:CCA tRNA nucleotidyltransferase [uncultured Clostridium sp.]|uniref:CCA tRNA nucleotidyltransferase n=1 Tax=uncultured Clostridium sp. TaxID=59620 RepID=UPI0025F6A8A3|nr:HD domain-containing protein [uncultured Clostridium sp.]
MNYNIEVPDDVQYILDTLYENGYEGYMVGGCVRDLILNREPNDYDITTNAKPDVVASLFDKVILTGIKHGTVTVVINQEQYEVTTYRNDGEYQDSRHPENVEFVNNIKEDLSRRDFTINAMAYNKKNGLVDYFNGIADLNNRIIRTVGNPEKRFKEDALRMLRALRFAVQLDFELDESILKTIKILCSSIEKISKERIREEFNKIILKNPQGIDYLHQCRLLPYVSDELEKTYGCSINGEGKSFDLYNHLIMSSCNIEGELYLRLAMLLHDISRADTDLHSIEEKNKSVVKVIINEYKDTKGHSLSSAYIAEKILKNLKYDNDTINKVKTLILYHHVILKDKADIKILLNCIGKELFEGILKVKLADINTDEFKNMKDEITKISIINKEYEEIISKNECFSMKNLKINGRDLIEIGIKDGRQVGSVLHYLLEKVIGDNDLNSREKLLDMASQKINEDNYL